MYPSPDRPLILMEACPTPVLAISHTNTVAVREFRRLQIHVGRSIGYKEGRLEAAGVEPTILKPVWAVPVRPNTDMFPRLPGDALLIDSRKNLVLLLRRALQYLRVDFFLLLGGRSANELGERRRQNLRMNILESKERHNYSPPWARTSASPTRSYFSSTWLSI